MLWKTLKPSLRQGIVMLDSGGSASSVVVGGANSATLQNSGFERSQGMTSFTCRQAFASNFWKLPCTDVIARIFLLPAPPGRSDRKTVHGVQMKRGAPALMKTS